MKAKREMQHIEERERIVISLEHISYHLSTGVCVVPSLTANEDGGHSVMKEKVKKEITGNHSAVPAFITHRRLSLRDGR